MTTRRLLTLCLVCLCFASCIKSRLEPRKRGAQKVALRTPFQRAIEHGMEPGANLNDELASFASYQITSVEDANVICAALARLCKEPTPSDADAERTRISGLLNLLSRAVYQAGQRDDEDEERELDWEYPRRAEDEDSIADADDAMGVLRKKAVPELVRIFAVLQERAGAQTKAAAARTTATALDVLARLVSFDTISSARLAVETAQSGFAEDDQRWHMVFSRRTATTSTSAGCWMRSMKSFPPAAPQPRCSTRRITRFRTIQAPTIRSIPQRVPRCSENGSNHPATMTNGWRSRPALRWRIARASTAPRL